MKLAVKQQSHGGSKETLGVFPCESTKVAKDKREEQTCEKRVEKGVRDVKYSVLSEFVCSQLSHPALSTSPFILPLLAHPASQASLTYSASSAHLCTQLPLDTCISLVYIHQFHVHSVCQIVEDAKQSHRAERPPITCLRFSIWLSVSQ